MKVERFSPDPETEPRHWVRHDQAFAMMLRPGSIEWGSERFALEKFDYTAGAERSLELARANGWTVISIKDDWAKVFA